MTYTAAASCEGKEAFDTPHLAWTAANRRKGRVAYRCDHCGLWHVGNDYRGRK